MDCLDPPLRTGLEYTAHLEVLTHEKFERRHLILQDKKWQTLVM